MIGVWTELYIILKQKYNHNIFVNILIKYIFYYILIFDYHCTSICLIVFLKFEIWNIIFLTTNVSLIYDLILIFFSILFIIT